MEGGGAGLALEAGGEATARTARCLARRSGSARLDTATAGERKATAAAGGMAARLEGARGWRQARGGSGEEAATCAAVDSGTLTSDRNQSGELWNTETRVHCVADASVSQCRSKCFSVTNLFIFRSNVTNLFCSIENLYREQVQIRWEFFLCLYHRIYV